MSGGPFRDTLTPLIAEAQRQLSEIRKQRAALEIRYEKARGRLDGKIGEPASFVATLEATAVPSSSRPDPRAAKIAFIVGLVLGLLTWIPIIGHPDRPFGVGVGRGDVPGRDVR